MRRSTAVLVLVVLTAACAGGGDGEPEAGGTGDDPRFEIVFVGDVLLDDAAQDDLDEHGYTWPFEHVAELLVADYVIGNQEGPITERSEPHDPDQRFHYNARPAAASALAEAGFDAVGLANNHLWDRGPDGLSDTRRHLESAGVGTFGAGADLDEALAPLLVDTPDGMVAVVGYATAFQPEAVAGGGLPGLLVPTEETVATGLRRASDAGADSAIAYIHWGSNYSTIDAAQRGIARALVDAGFDAVVGHHPHVQQGVELIEGRPVFYSLGNFVFGTPGRFDDEFPGFGLVARAFVGGNGLERWELRCIVTDNDIVRFQPRPCDPFQAQEILGGLGPDVEVVDGVGVIEPGG